MFFHGVLRVIDLCFLNGQKSTSIVYRQKTSEHLYSGQNPILSKILLILDFFFYNKKEITILHWTTDQSVHPEYGAILM